MIHSGANGQCPQLTMVSPIASPIAKSKARYLDTTKCMRPLTQALEPRNVSTGGRSAARREGT